MKHLILKFVLKNLKVDQSTLIRIHDEAMYGKEYMEYIERYRKYIYDDEPYPTDQISTVWRDSTTFQRLSTFKKTKTLLSKI